MADEFCRLNETVASLRTAKRKCEDEQKVILESHKALQREVENLKEEIKSMKSKLKQFLYSETSPLSEILDFLAKSCGGNDQAKGIVNITTSTTESSFSCENITSQGWTDYWYSQDVPNSWICFDFKDKSI
jgi:uncharacterized protein YlxW (UPF0749 family)